MNDYYPFGMEQPGRVYTESGIGNYRYGFNGKESDNEVKGNGDQLDYGMRIYDPRAGRFLSVDPLVKRFPAWSPYPFAMNNPIEGVDLDGGEYLSSKESRIEVINGIVKFKVSNMHETTRNMITNANEDPHNWTPGPDGKPGWGISLAVGYLSLQQYNTKTDADYNATDNTPGAPDPNFVPGETKVQNPTAKSTGLPDRRYKDRTVSSATPGGAKGLAIASIAIDLAIIGTNWLIQHNLDDDVKIGREHLGVLKMAAYDVTQALQNGEIPKEYQTNELLSDITNYVLSGVSNLNNKQVIELGKMIYNKYSMQRKQIKETIQVMSPNGGVIKTIKVLNPTYNPNYGKEDPGKQGGTKDKDKASKPATSGTGK